MLPLQTNKQHILISSQSIPTVHGGVLWGDSVNKRFYLYGGEWTGGTADAVYTVLGYDVLYNHWDDFGLPRIKPPPQVAAYGAGVGVSEIGTGYYYGGYISNASMSGWSQPRKMSSNFYSYDYDSKDFTQAASPDDLPRAEGAMVWIPAGDARGLLVYMGGVVSQNDTVQPQGFDEIFVYDPTDNSWLNQSATGEVPQNRRQFCMDVAWAPDRSSYNMYRFTPLESPLYLWGGHKVTPPEVNVTSYNDIYILSMPSFNWVKAFPGNSGNYTLPPKFGHYAASCNMVKSMSQMLVIGGTYTDTNDCDLAYEIWGQHNFWTGTSQNAGDNTSYYWALYNPNITTNVVPIDVYNVTGGDKMGGANLTAPQKGFDPGNELLQTLFDRKPVIPDRKPTRDVNMNSSDTSSLSGGAIAGIVIGSVAGLGLLLLAWYYLGKRVLHRREERRQERYSISSQTGNTPGLSSVRNTPMSMISRQKSAGTRGTASSNYPSPSPMEQGPPVELNAEQVPGELPSGDPATPRIINELPAEH
ncbi:unnamed protein product [Clonostachys chloroleuca]|uniref:Kelch repeat protein n=1 Tax=Clonostachys chloroleuca TaxID=1926264 RepID=A0AA35Q466_9HYPO|nr:unnamed protein product [Clonostachys chloroleuca]